GRPRPPFQPDRRSIRSGRWRRTRSEARRASRRESGARRSEASPPACEGAGWRSRPRARGAPRPEGGSRGSSGRLFFLGDQHPHGAVLLLEGAARQFLNLRARDLLVALGRGEERVIIAAEYFVGSEASRLGV